METFEKEISEIEEEIFDETNIATHKEQFNIFRRNFKNHALSMRILIGILIINSIIQTGLLITILILLKDIFYQLLI